MENKLDTKILSRQEMRDRYSVLKYLKNKNYEYTRTEYISKFGFVGLCTEFVDDLVNYFKGKHVLSVMSGTGYLEKVLYDRGIDIKASDTFEFYHDQFYLTWKSYMDIENLSGLDAIEKYKDWADIVIMSWPYMDNDAYEIGLKLKEYNIPLLYIGEGYSGCTANDKFIDLIYEGNIDYQLAKNYFKFECIYDIPVVVTWK